MNEIESLRDELQLRFPEASFHMSPPVRTEDYWTLDICYKDRWLVVEWALQSNFGVSVILDSTGYGEGPDELHSNSDEAVKRIVEVLSK